MKLSNIPIPVCYKNTWGPILRLLNLQLCTTPAL
jgi:hypothetical protein